ncbi:cupredoxin domain-containing protein [Candidatus Acetothermia bacterium]|nr:cupredoxin domain-containing protein [Candidatus Acetothermia bacterium]MBI3461128.1 cupredoxin domain-containing protein [Candidatus Acetothermia bacterium]MBI3660112.1 cupredoxin domain-containing protein [Candidatus Acetothermia bacterium]
MHSRRQFFQFVGTVGMTFLLSSCDLMQQGGGPTPQSQQIQVTLREWEIVPANISAKAGRVRFVVSNEGTINHGFEIEGMVQGTKFEKEIEPLVAGQTKTLEVDLAPGEYEVYCPVPGHKAKGMKGELTVQP